MGLAEELVTGLIYGAMIGGIISCATYLWW